ncbi:MAG: Ku protein, partial [Bryobacteraceae bacterium]
VVVEDEELKQVAPASASTMDVLQFVGNEDVDPLYFESSYYVAPEEKASKPYALFLAALVKTSHNAIAKVVMHNREHVVLIRPSQDGLVLHTLYYADELHQANKSAAPRDKFTAKELDMAGTLVRQLTAPFKPEQFHDTYRENVERLVREKQKGKKITTISQPRKAPVIDLMEALQRAPHTGEAKPHRARGNGKKPSGRRKAA